jgi:Protein of unknown function (DUF2628)
MASFALFCPKSATPLDPARIVLVRESFSLWGFLLPLPFCLWHRNWRLSGLLVLIGLALIVLPSFGIMINEGSVLAVELLMGLYVGFAAADIRAAALERRDYDLVDVVMARDEDSALLRFLDQSMNQSLASTRHAPHQPAASSPSPASVPAMPLGTSGVLGLFPESQR